MKKERGVLFNAEQRVTNKTFDIIHLRSSQYERKPVAVDSSKNYFM